MAALASFRSSFSGTDESIACTFLSFYFWPLYVEVSVNRESLHDVHSRQAARYGVDSNDAPSLLVLPLYFCVSIPERKRSVMFEIRFHDNYAVSVDAFWKGESFLYVLHTASAEFRDRGYFNEARA